MKKKHKEKIGGKRIYGYSKTSNLTLSE